MIKPVLSTVIAALFSLSCASGELPPKAANDPSNAAAEAPPLPSTSSTPEAPAAPEPSGTMPGHHHSGAMPMPSGSASATVYTCPMHPEVTSDAPGKCPKCGMTLVPKKGP